MKRKVFDYPDDERVLIVRSSVSAICDNNKPASKLLSLLLSYHEEEKQSSFRRTDAELLRDLVDEMTAKTLKTTAIPMLQAFGYLSTPEKDLYVLDIDAINRAMSQGQGSIINPSRWSKLQEDKVLRIVQRNLHRARKKHLPATLTVDQWRAAVMHFNGKCAYCLERDYQVLEHVVPLSAQNSAGTVLSNCVPACYPCNTNNKKYNQPGFAAVIVYLESVAYLNSGRGE